MQLKSTSFCSQQLPQAAARPAVITNSYGFAAAMLQFSRAEHWRGKGSVRKYAWNASAGAFKRASAGGLKMRKPNGKGASTF